MEKINLYLSPSTQEHNPYAFGNTVEEVPMNAVADVTQRELARTNAFNIFRNRPDMTLNQVVEDSNNKVGKKGIHFAIHSNACNEKDKGKARGCEVVAFGKNTNSAKLATAVYNELSPSTPTGDRGVIYNPKLAEIGATDATAALAEIAFHDNFEDARWILGNIEAIGIAIAKGICKYCGVAFVPYVAPAPAPVVPVAPAQRTYVIKNGDSLSKIALRFYGNGNLYMKIFNANKNVLKSPNVISAGVTIVIPN